MTNRKTYKGEIVSLFPGQYYVFGSNTEGRHGLGSALIAREKFGAIYGQAEGLQGRSYAIITKDLTKNHHPSRTVEQIKEQIKKFYDFISQPPYDRYEFFVVYKAKKKNLNFYSDKQMAKMFDSFLIPKNVVFEAEFYKLFENDPVL
jgi:hypothetical protein